MVLEPVSRENWRDCVALDVLPEQRAFLKSNAYALAQAAYEPDMWPFVARRGDTIIGFVNLWKAVEGGYYIAPLMVDARWQRQGFGRAILRLALERLHQIGDCRIVFITHHKDNLAAAALYRSEGFRDTGMELDGEPCLRLDL